MLRPTENSELTTENYVDSLSMQANPETGPSGHAALAIVIVLVATFGPRLTTFGPQPAC